MYAVTYSHHHPTKPSVKLVFHTREEAIRIFREMSTGGLVRCAYVEKLKITVIDGKLYRVGTIIRRATHR